VVRELAEELGITVAVVGIYEVVYHRYPERTVLVLAYRCRWTAGELVDLQVAGHSWVTPGQLLDYQLLPADVPLAARLARDCGDAGSTGL
jgi:8-oxo-dGTP diphosphatase